MEVIALIFGGFMAFMVSAQLYSHFEDSPKNRLRKLKSSSKLPDEKPKNGISLANARRYIAERQYEYARSILRDLLREDNTNGELVAHELRFRAVLLDIAYTYTAEGNYHQALKELAIFQARYPDDLQAHADKADVYRRMDDLDSAIGILQHINRTPPLYVDSLRVKDWAWRCDALLGWYYALKGDYQGALTEFLRSDVKNHLKTPTSDPKLVAQVLAKRGIVYHLQGLPNQATNDFNRALDLVKTDPLALLGRMAVLAELSDWHAVKALWQTFQTEHSHYATLEALDEDLGLPLALTRQLLYIRQRMINN